MPVTDQIKTFARIGFDGFFTDWQSDYPFEEWVRTAKDTGMIYQSIHAPFGRAADMWGEDESKGELALNELLEHPSDYNLLDMLVSHLKPTHPWIHPHPSVYYLLYILDTH